jgi:undecaprenyl-diphosphatase
VTAAAHLALPLASAVTWFQAVVLGLLQGVTELFPISSLGHTVLFPTLFGWNSLVHAQSQSHSFWLAFVVMLHVGSAIGLLIYFWRDWVRIIRAFFVTLSTRRIETSDERLAWLIIVASIPAGLIALALERPLRVVFSKPLAAALFLMVNGGILYGAEQLRKRAVAAEASGGPSRPRPYGVDGAPSETPRAPGDAQGDRQLETFAFREALIIGFAQSTALLAGISRDGVTMAAGLLRGLSREDAAKFAFLLATPVILAAGLFKLPDITGHLGDGIRGQAVLAAACAALAAIGAVHFLVRYFKTQTLIPFAIYCEIFGLAMVIYTAT